ncbi:MAG: hydrogenase large subunit, partial [Methanomassiliicoccales archaeon]|nr:hydrogenase large subunit [Methanomassiliicoccales archaeon]
HLHDWPRNEHPLSPTFPRARKVPRTGDQFHHHKVEGEGILEIPVGPVHAGVIEPGHFRFSTAGEPILNLEIRLGYAHRGVEKTLEGCPLPQALRLIERISGDNGVAHSMAFCQAVEMGTAMPERAKLLRCIYAEMERIYNHLGDIGGMATDVAFAVPAADAAVLREKMLQLNQRLTGHRLLWGTMAIGGVARNIDLTGREVLERSMIDLGLELDPIERTLSSAPSFLDRVETTGSLSLQAAKDLRATGPVARASGWDRDTRRDFPYAAYPRLSFLVPVQRGGDVLARLKVKMGEVRESISLVKQCLDHLQVGEHRIEVPTPHGFGLGMVESPRGELVHCAHFDQGRIVRYKVRDPSFCNWPTLERAVLGNIVPDFPLINKSYNLSYAGNDL